MQPDEIKNLHYGNVIEDAVGARFLILHVIRNPATGELEHIGVVPALSPEDLNDYTIVSKTRSETYLAGKTIAG